LSYEDALKKFIFFFFGLKFVPYIVSHPDILNWQGGKFYWMFVFYLVSLRDTIMNHIPNCPPTIKVAVKDVCSFLIV